MGAKKKAGKRPGMGAALKASVQREATDKRGKFSTLEERARRADAILRDDKGGQRKEQGERSHGSDGTRPQAGREVTRQTVSLPPEDHARFLSIVARLEKAGLYSVPLSAVARAALRLLADLSDKALVEAVRGTPAVKTGRKPRVPA